MRQTMYPSLSQTAWLFVAALSIITGLYPALYFLVDMSGALLSTKSAGVLADAVWQLGFYTHIGFGGLSLLSGWPQFHRKWRDGNRSRHRLIGKAYVFFALLSAVSGIYIGFYATGGPVAAAGFISLGFIWLTTTWLAYRYARSGEVERHRRMMYYSYAACFAAVTLRLWLPFLIMATGDFVRSYQLVAWLCWAPNLGVAYWLNRKLTGLSPGHFL